MTPEQQKHFGELLWGQRSSNNLPDMPNFPVFNFLHLPLPPDIDVHAAIKSHILSLSPQGVVIRNTEDETEWVSPGWGWEHPLVREASLASKPIIQLADEARGEVEWTAEESKQLYLRARAWWENDKEVLEDTPSNGPFGDISVGPVLNALRSIGDFLARVVLPTMELAEEEWQQLLEWLQALRQVEVFPTVALPYLLLTRPSEAEIIQATIAADLASDSKGAVATAARAIRHWINLSVSRDVPKPSPNLLMTLIERVIFRCKPDVITCLWQLSCLIREQPETIEPSQAALLCASLAPWHQATMLPAPDAEVRDFLEAERPDLRAHLGHLAGVLQVWHTKCVPGAPQPAALSLWRELCAADTLPEIRRAFNAGCQR